MGPIRHFALTGAEMERQLALFAALTRWEIPEGRYSWREGSETKRLIIGAHCVDLAWPWWRPWMPWKS